MTSGSPAQSHDMEDPNAPVIWAEFQDFAKLVAKASK